MAEFCTKCFAALNEDGQCPACGHRNTPIAVVEEPVAAPVYVAKFCMKCGGGLGENGLCPVCDAPAPAPVAKFCMKCGGGLDENGLCPVCDAPAPAPVAKFCMKCGGGLDENGLCPVCDAPAPAPMVDLAEMAQSDTPVEPTNAEPVDASTTQPAPEATAPKKKSSAWSVIATILLSICLFITMLASVGIIAVRTTVSEGGAYNLAEELDVATMLQSSGVANGDNFDELYMRLERDYGVKLDDEELADLIEDSTLPDYVAKKVGHFSDDFFSGDAELVITKQEMTELIEENLDLINDAQVEGYQGRRVQPEDCDEIADWMFNGDELVLMSTDDFAKSSATLYQMANICLSWLALGFFLLLSALIGFAMCRNSLSQAAIGGGVVFILLGGVAALAAAVVAWIPGLWASIAGNNLILSLVGSLLTVNGLIFAILLVLCILMLVARTVVKHILKKKVC